MSKRTPGPWEQNSSFRIYVAAPDGSDVCRMIGDEDHELSYAIMNANAAFIVRAENSFDEMVAALQGALVAMTIASKLPSVDLEYDFGPACLEVTSALKAAGAAP